MNAKKICHLLETMRWLGVGLGFGLALAWGKDPQHQLHILMPWLVISLAGLTGIESVFFSQAAAQITGYTPSAYQRQSGINNVAVALTAVLVLILNWGVFAEATVLSALLIFLFFSACNHGWSAWKEGNRNLRNILRPIMTIILIAASVPFIIRAI
ncbi:MAG: DUF6790 family protein [Pseudomonadota bacterium]